MIKYRYEQAGEFQTQINTEALSFPTLVASSSVTVNLGLSPRKQWFNQAWISQITLGTYGGTATVTIQSFVNGVTTALTAATDLTNATQVANVTYTLPALSTLTDIQRELPGQFYSQQQGGAAGSILQAVFTLSSTVSVQPTFGMVGAELFILR